MTKTKQETISQKAKKLMAENTQEKLVSLVQKQPMTRETVAIDRLLEEVKRSWS